MSNKRKQVEGGWCVIKDDASCDTREALRILSAKV